MTADEILVFASRLSPVLMVCLILLGIGLLAAELFVVSFGLLAAAGLACIVLGLAALLQTWGDPGAFASAAEALGLSVTYVFLGVVVVVAGLIGWLVLQAQRQARLRYGKPHLRSSPDSGLLPADSHRAELIQGFGGGGDGKIFYRGAVWTAKWDPDSPGAQNAAEGSSCTVTEVEVTRWDGLIAFVRPHAPTTASMPSSARFQKPAPTQEDRAAHDHTPGRKTEP